MKTSGNIEKIKLVDEDGREVSNVFFNNAYELWNSEQTQLTLLLDPARVKSGLVANESYGRALKPNKKYTLLIEDLENVYHYKMRSPFEKIFEVAPADMQAPDIGKWQINIPKAGSKEAFSLEFPEMLDYNSINHQIALADSDHKRIIGSARIDNEETTWLFHPKHSWEAGTYTLYVNSRLEDPAGNNLNGLFDHKIGSLKNEMEGVIEKLTFNIE
ncbi:MAG: hypothetical protein AAF361_10860 [Bacteroidota bacterium]